MTSPAPMGSLVFIGLGLKDETSMTLAGLEEVRQADSVFAEFYTNLMPALDLGRLERLIGKKIRILRRAQLEEEGGRDLVQAAQQGRASLLVPGDPMIATTHIALRISLAKKGIKSRVIHAPSVMSAICGATGLQSYKFGKAVTIPYDPPLPGSVLDTISDNYARGLHTLLLLDVRSSQDKQLTITEAIRKIMSTDVNLENRLAVGVARLGSNDEKVKASTMRTLIEEDFGHTPHSIVAIGKLHFMEREALELFCDARKSDLREHI